MYCTESHFSEFSEFGHMMRRHKPNDKLYKLSTNWIFIIIENNLWSNYAICCWRHFDSHAVYDRITSIVYRFIYTDELTVCACVKIVCCKLWSWRIWQMFFVYYIVNISNLTKRQCSQCFIYVNLQHIHGSGFHIIKFEIL